MGLPLRFVLSVACLLVCCPALLGRFIESWPIKRLFAEADVVIIAAAERTTDVPVALIDDRWPLELAGRETTFEINHVLKGQVPRSGKIGVLYFNFGKLRHGAKKDEPVIDGPLFVNFRVTPKKVGVSRVEYLIFLRKRPDGRYAPVSGDIDSKLAVRELVTPQERE